MRERREDIPRLSGYCVEERNRQRAAFSRSLRPPKQGRPKDQERDLIERTLAKNGGNRTRTAAELGISRRTLQNRIREIGLIGKE